METIEEQENTTRFYREFILVNHTLSAIAKQGKYVMLIIKYDNKQVNQKLKTTLTDGIHKLHYYAAFPYPQYVEPNETLSPYHMGYE